MKQAELRQEMVGLIEAYYWRKSVVPTSTEQIDREFMVETSSEIFIEVMNRSDCVRYLVDHGVPITTRLALTPKQLRWIEAICSPLDARPIALKMKEQRVSQSEHQRWLREPLFSRILHDEGSKILPNERERVLKSLANEAISGSVQAVKLFLELTGEYTPTAAITANSEVKVMMSNILDILQSHVSPLILNRVADEFEYLIMNGIRRPANVVLNALGQTPESFDLLEEIEVIKAVESGKTPENDLNFE